MHKVTQLLSKWGLQLKNNCLKFQKYGQELEKCRPCDSLELWFAIANSIGIAIDVCITIVTMLMLQC